MTFPSTCPRCGIGHNDSPQRARRDALCADCQESYGRAWAQQARREVARLTRVAS